MARSGCALPSRERLCQPFAQHQEWQVLGRIRPGDRLLLVSNLASCFNGMTSKQRGVVVAEARRRRHFILG